MNILLLLVAALLLIPAALYLFAPGLLLGAARKMLRRKGGMVEKRITVDGLDWPYLEGGDPAGEVVVLVHGFGGDKDNWSFYAPYLTSKYRLICPDLPGFGENTRDPAGDYAGIKQAERLGQFLAALGVERCHLGGNSMGGYIALLFALAQPGQLRSLTLFNNAGVIGTAPSELQNMVEGNAAATPLVPRSAAELKRLLGFIVHRPRFVPARFLDVMFAENAPHQALLDAVFAQLLDDMLNRPLNDRLGEVLVPTQIIWGRYDQLIDVSCGAVQQAGIKLSELVVLDDVGHVPMIEQPALTAQHHLGFLAKH